MTEAQDTSTDTGQRSAHETARVRAAVAAFWTCFCGHENWSGDDACEACSRPSTLEPSAPASPAPSEGDEEHEGACPDCGAHHGQACTWLCPNRAARERWAPALNAAPPEGREPQAPLSETDAQQFDRWAADEDQRAHDWGRVYPDQAAECARLAGVYRRAAAALRATPVQQQEPVAWVIEEFWKGRPSGDRPRILGPVDPKSRALIGGLLAHYRAQAGELTYTVTPLYAAPPAQAAPGERERALEIEVRRVEWSVQRNVVMPGGRMQMMGHCPVCYCSRTSGHAAGCSLLAALSSPASTHEEERETVDEPEPAPGSMHRCHSDRDGECEWRWCPQKREYRSGCPLYPWDADEGDGPTKFPYPDFAKPVQQPEPPPCLTRPRRLTPFRERSKAHEPKHRPHRCNARAR